MTAKLVVEGLTHHYPDEYTGESVHALDNIDLQVKNGESFVLVGHNGAGKTTIMKLMLGLTQPSAGQVFVMGKNPASRSFSANRRVLGYLPESVSFYHHMTGLELLSYYARLKGLPKSEIGQRLATEHIADHRLGGKSQPHQDPA